MAALVASLKRGAVGARHDEATHGPMIKRTPGRPPLDKDDPSVPITVSLPSKKLAACSEHAKQDRMTVQDWIRRVLQQASQSNKTG